VLFWELFCAPSARQPIPAFALSLLA